MKTANIIKADIKGLLDNSPLAHYVAHRGGAVYVDTRPTDSTKPDCVISLLMGETGQVSVKGLLLVKVFYADKLLGDTWYENMCMGNVLQELLYGFSESLMGNLKYNFSRYGRQVFSEQPKELEASHQRYAILRMNFNINNHLK